MKFWLGLLGNNTWDWKNQNCSRRHTKRKERLNSSTFPVLAVFGVLVLCSNFVQGSSARSHATDDSLEHAQTGIASNHLLDREKGQTEDFAEDRLQVPGKESVHLTESTAKIESDSGPKSTQSTQPNTKVPKEVISVALKTSPLLKGISGENSPLVPVSQSSEGKSGESENSDAQRTKDNLISENGVSSQQKSSSSHSDRTGRKEDKDIIKKTKKSGSESVDSQTQSDSVVDPEDSAVQSTASAHSMRTPQSKDDEKEPTTQDEAVAENDNTGSERQKYVDSLSDSDKQTKKAESQLIRDAVTAGNHGVTSEGQQSVGSSGEQRSDSDFSARDEFSETMEQAEKLRWGSKEVKPDYGKAYALCEFVASRGGLDGLNCLGEFHRHGLGRPQDPAMASRFFREAGDKGHAAAQRNLAFLYSVGHGVPQNTALAVLHLHFAAVSGDHLAQSALGYRHMYGIGVPKNCQTAMEFYLPAAEYVVKRLHANRAQAMIEKQPLAPEAGGKPKSLDLDEDVVNYYTYSAERGDTAAQVALGQLHFTGGRGLQQDYAEAFRWYLRAAEKGDGAAMGHLGNMYAQGIFVPADNQTALLYFRNGVDKGNALALNGLGFMSMYGMGVPQSYEEALKSFTKAAEQGSQEARFNLGALHVGGYGVPKDYAKALYFFTLAANRGHLLALYNLAMMHHNGFGTPRSCPNAVQFIKSVAERGEWAARLQVAHRLYARGDGDRALLVYLEMAELGMDVAQANAAHIYDEAGTPLTRGRQAQALRLYELSAQQGNAAAELKIGDYYYHGWGCAANHRKAVAHYRAASEARVAQAMFNLAWMHEHGRGVARDRHLAKRFYDMAAEASPEAAWPAGICLARLALESAAEALVQRLDELAAAANLRLVAGMGAKWRLPLSPEWLPLLETYWDALLAVLLLAALAQVLAFRALLTARRLRATGRP